MSNQPHDGGPAFPFFRPEMRAAGGKVIRAHDERDGMSLRDYFAAKALALYTDAAIQAAVRAEARERGISATTIIAACAYEFADAMLRARAQPSEAQGPAAKQAEHIATWGHK